MPERAMSTQIEIPAKTIDFFTKKLADEEKKLVDANAPLSNIKHLMNELKTGIDEGETSIQMDLLHNTFAGLTDYLSRREKTDQYKKEVKIVIAQVFGRTKDFILFINGLH